MLLCLRRDDAYPLGTVGERPAAKIATKVLDGEPVCLQLGGDSLGCVVLEPVAIDRGRAIRLYDNVLVEEHVTGWVVETLLKDDMFAAAPEALLGDIPLIGNAVMLAVTACEYVQGKPSGRFQRAVDILEQLRAFPRTEGAEVPIDEQNAVELRLEVERQVVMEDVVDIQTALLGLILGAGKRPHGVVDACHVESTLSQPRGVEARTASHVE